MQEIRIISIRLAPLGRTRSQFCFKLKHVFRQVKIGLNIICTPHQSWLISIVSWFVISFVLFSFKGSLSSRNDSSSGDIPDDLFHISVINNNKQYPVATVTLIQKYPIKCFYAGDNIVWKRLRMEDNLTTENCFISIYPKIYYGENKQHLTSIQTSKCPIRFENASTCSFSNTTSINSMMRCNIIQFNITLGEEAKETLLLNRHSTYSRQYLEKTVII